MRAADGRELDGVLDEDAMVRHFGTERVPPRRPTLVVIVAGVRGGKTFLASGAVAHAALTADLSPVPIYEIPRISIVAPAVDAAAATFSLLSGAIRSSPILQRYVESSTAESIIIKRDDGRKVEIKVVAAHRGGLTLRNRWSAGFVMEEVAQFGAEAGGYTVNAEEILRAGETRLLPGCQGWIISSPYGPEGLLYELYKDHFGKPGRYLVVHAPTLALNPVTVSREMVEAIRAKTPDVAAREYDAQWLDPDTAFFAGQHLEAAQRRTPLELPFDELCHYVAAIDPGTRANSWTLIVATKPQKVSTDGSLVDKISVVLAREWKGSRQDPLSPDKVMGEIAEVVKPYGVTTVASDIHMADALRDIGNRHGISVWADTAITSKKKLDMFETLRALLADGRLEIPAVPELLADLRHVRKRVAANAISVHLPVTPNGRHCDYASALALCCSLSIMPAMDPPEGIPRGWTRQEYDAVLDYEKRQRGETDGWLTEREWITNG